MKNIRNYIIVASLAFIVVLSCFFMPEITDVFGSRNEKTYSYRTNKTNISISMSIPYAMRFTEGFSEAEIYYENDTNLSYEEAINIAKDFFYSMSSWKYGCTLDFLSVDAKLVRLDENEKGVVWDVKFFSETLKSTLCFAVNDSTSYVIGFYSYNEESVHLNDALIIKDYNYYIEKFLPDISKYYKWSTSYSNMQSVINGVISYKVGFVEKDGGNASIMYYYNYKNGNVIFNMNENVAEENSYFNLTSELEGE